MSLLSSDRVEEIVRQSIAGAERTGALPEGAGVGVAVVNRAGPVYLGAFGRRDRERALPVTRRTLFEVGSLTKALTATAVMLAVEEGRWSLDEPVASRTNVLRLHDPDASRRVSLEDLLSHRTGLPSHDPLFYFAGPNVEARDLTARLRHLPLLPDGFREVFAYNNLLYGAVGVLFEDVLGEPWDAFVTVRVLEPLGMTTSRVGPPVAEDDDVALGYSGETRIPRKDLGSIAPAAALRSSVDDMSRWLAFHLHAGRTETGRQLLTPERYRSMADARIAVDQERNPPVFQGLEWLGRAGGYGLGWFLGSAFGHEALYHPGYVDGYSAATVVVPDLDVGVAVLTNLNLSAFPASLCERIVAEAAGGDAAGRAVTALPAGAPPLPEPTPSSAPPDCDWAGRYENAAYGVLELAQTDGGPVARHGEHSWPLAFGEDGSLTVTLPMYGLQLPLPSKLVTSGRVCRAVEIPLALDPSAPPVPFTRVRGS